MQFNSVNFFWLTAVKGNTKIEGLTCEGTVPMWNEEPSVSNSPIISALAAQYQKYHILLVYIYTHDD